MSFHGAGADRSLPDLVTVPEKRPSGPHEKRELSVPVLGTLFVRFAGNRMRK
jgi:hypothetical protein